MIWRGQIPKEWSGCTKRDLACTAIWSGPPDYHITQAQIVFNEDYNDQFETSNLFCLTDYGYDVQTVALHEFGHFARYLRHSTHADDAMYGQEYNGCLRTPSDHDIESMNAQYSGHPTP